MNGIPVDKLIELHKNMLMANASPSALTLAGPREDQSSVYHWLGNVRERITEREEAYALRQKKAEREERRKMEKPLAKKKMYGAPVTAASYASYAAYAADVMASFVPKDGDVAYEYFVVPLAQSV